MPIATAVAATRNLSHRNPETVAGTPTVTYAALPGTFHPKSVTVATIPNRNIRCH